MKKDRNPPVKPITKEIKRDIEMCVLHVQGRKQRLYLRQWITKLLETGALSPILLKDIPTKVENVGKTKFDQIFDACQSLAFPGYRDNTLKRMMGEQIDPAIKVWRVIIPPQYGVSSILMRAYTYQDAFALACDYVCRASLRINGKIPVDITIRVMFMSERALKRHLKIREMNANSKRKILKLIGREFTDKQLEGARAFALGHFRNDPKRSLASYIEKKDLYNLETKKGLVRVSAVESEIMMSDMKLLNGPKEESPIKPTRQEILNTQEEMMENLELDPGVEGEYADGEDDDEYEDDEDK